MLLVTGTTVITPRPSRAAVALARSLLTITAGRRLLASLPRTGSKSTCQISPRRIPEPVVRGVLPNLVLAGCRPLRPSFVVVIFQSGVAEHTNRTLQTRGPRR